MRPSWGMDSAWLLPFLLCAGAREKIPRHSRAQPLPRSQPSPGTAAGQAKALSVKPRKARDVNAALESADAVSALQGELGGSQGPRLWEARAGFAVPSRDQLRSSGKAEAEQRRGNAAGEQQQQLAAVAQAAWPRAVATKKVHFGFNLIKRINNYQLSQFGLTTIPSAEVPS